MITDNVVREALKDTFFRYAVAKGCADRICWSGNALVEKYKVEPWFKATILPMEPDNRFRSVWFTGIYEIDVIVRANTGLTVLNSYADEILSLFPIAGKTYKEQQYSIYKAYKEQEQTEGSYLIQPLLMYYEALVYDNL